MPCSKRKITGGVGGRRGEKEGGGKEETKNRGKGKQVGKLDRKSPAKWLKTGTKGGLVSAGEKEPLQAVIWEWKEGMIEWKSEAAKWGDKQPEGVLQSYKMPAVCHCSLSLCSLRRTEWEISLWLLPDTHTWTNTHTPFSLWHVQWLLGFSLEVFMSWKTESNIYCPLVVITISMSVFLQNKHHFFGFFFLSIFMWRCVY